MTPAGDIGADEGGEAPCFAHLLDEPQPALDDVVPAPHVARSEGDCRAGSGTGCGVGDGEAGSGAEGSASPGA